MNGNSKLKGLASLLNLSNMVLLSHMVSFISCKSYELTDELHESQIK